MSETRRTAYQSHGVVDKFGSVSGVVLYPCFKRNQFQDHSSLWWVFHIVSYQKFHLWPLASPRPCDSRGPFVWFHRHQFYRHIRHLAKDHQMTETTRCKAVILRWGIKQQEIVRLWRLRCFFVFLLLCPKHFSVNVGVSVPLRSPLNQSSWLLTLSEGQIPFTLTSSHHA